MTHYAGRLGLGLLLIAAAACSDAEAPTVGEPSAPDAAEDAAAQFAPQDAATATPDEGPPARPEDAQATDLAPEDPPVEDAAEVVSASFPAELACGETAAALVTMRNTGSATWTKAGGYKLGGVDDEDPFKAGDKRIWLDETVSVGPQMVHTFEIPLTAPDTAGVYTTDWRMVHETVTWFGDTTAHEITVSCEELDYPLPLPDMSDTVDALAGAHPDLLANSCQNEGGTWEFMDLLVVELRKTDTRWGYNWKRGVVGDPSQDVVDYHFGPGESEGSIDVYIIDVIVGHCGPNPSPGFLDQTQATADQGEIGKWTSMGKF